MRSPAAKSATSIRFTEDLPRPRDSGLMAACRPAEDLLVLSLRRNRIVTVLFTAVAAAAAPATAGAAVRVVAPNGNDKNPGGPVRPWRTLQHAADVAVPGTTIVVRPGRYAGFQV